MNRVPPRLAAAALVASVALLVSACSGGTAATPDSTATTAPTGSSAATSAADPSTSATAAAAPTCETIIPEQTVSDFASVGWTYREETFRVATLELTGGIQCTWGDYTVASDHVQIYGWAPITADQATTARAELLADGWVAVDASDGDFVTENPETAVATDDNGYGMTFQFGDGWIKLADTKQGLVLIEWPPAG